ncbi:MAG: hypothetical protein OEV49_06455 [candidate division Zixibacteria bacterium]|nr:hypothetical protein [candidate division Zixibacteria bacterium]MDH3935863.1 hypothetical protein [candidate division Zixibacteria bacterium]MDH4032893.1 hypothetical protein [candidate division Zixibacteria bacterium]
MTSLDEFLDEPKFATCINCIDGRTQLPVINFVKETYQIDYVDLITEPGADLMMATRNPDKLPSIKERVKLSVEKHKSELIILVGHGDCAGNPVSEEEHLGHLRRGMECLRGWELDADIVGLYVTDKDWSVDEFAVITR